MSRINPGVEKATRTKVTYRVAQMAIGLFHMNFFNINFWIVIVPGDWPICRFCFTVRITTETWT